MLTRQQTLVTYDFSRRLIYPDRLIRTKHAAYVPIAADLIRLYHQHVGRPRCQLHQQVHQRMTQLPECPARRIAALTKLLDDASEYARDDSGKSWKLRKRVFGEAAQFHPLVKTRDQLFGHQEADVKGRIASQIGRSWEEIEADLFADVIEFHRLVAGPADLQPETLLRRYNVAQTQGALYDAVGLTIHAGSDYKRILRGAKLARLMHRIGRTETGYTFRLTGPASVLRGTRRYGTAFAKFLPSLLAAKDWRMQANVIGPRQQQFSLHLTDTDGLQADTTDDAFDSDLERRFDESWRNAETGGWELHRESTVLHRGQSVFLPDFTLVHPKFGVVLLEIVGFWTPEYLSEKARKLTEFRHHGTILLAVAESNRDALPDLGLTTVIYRNQLPVKKIIAALPSVEPSGS